MRSAGWRLIVVVGACLIGGTARADSLEEIFARANAAYFRGDYDTAADEYYELVELGVIDADVSFNLATTEARRAHYGAAIRYYEQSLWLRPGDDDAQAGLEAARAAVGARRAQRHGEAEVDTGPPLDEALFGSISGTALAITALVAESLLFLSLLVLLFQSRESRRLAAWITAPLATLVFAAAVAGFVLRSGWLDEGEAAVVLRENAPIFEGPNDQATERHHAVEGQRAWILASETGWTRVHVPNVGEGWMRASDTGRVQPSHP